MKTYVIIDGYECRVWVPYEYREATRGIFGRKWDNDTKQWTFPRDQAQLVAVCLRGVGLIVKVVSTAPQPAPMIAGNWAERVFDRNCDKTIYRRLTRILHPDTGGDGQLQQELNDAWRDCGCVGSTA